MHGLGDLWSNGKDNEELPSTPLVAGPLPSPRENGSGARGNLRIWRRNDDTRHSHGDAQLRRAFLKKSGGVGLLR